MALQAKLPLLDFSEFEKERKNEYFLAVQKGLDRNYQPMGEVFSAVISLTLKRYGDES